MNLIFSRIGIITVLVHLELSMYAHEDMATNRSSHVPLETVNPADLTLSGSRNEQDAPSDNTPLNEADGCDQLLSDSVQNISWPNAPIFAGDQTDIVQQGQQLPGTGWEHRIWNGDLSFSSYGSSPVESPSGWQHLVRRFGEHNIYANPLDGHVPPAVSRDASFSSFAHQQHPVSSKIIQERPRKTGVRRGRLCADMAFDGPETVFEDSDSHHSWSAADNSENWSAHLREQLIDFRHRRERVSILTSHLQTRQRRKVHSMANLWGLSHMSVGSGRQKRMLISKCELRRSAFGPSSMGRRWNPTKNNWFSGLVDPSIVLIDRIAPNMSIERLEHCLAECELAMPLRVTLDSGSPDQHDTLSSITAYARFANADDAAVALLALDNTKPNWNGLDLELECDYVRFPRGFDFSEPVLDQFETLPEAIRQANLQLQQRGNLHLVPSEPMTSDSESDVPSHASPIFTRHRPSRTSSTSLQNLLPRDSGYISAGSTRSVLINNINNSSDHDASETSTTTHTGAKKRKRDPKIAGGYPCSFHDCGRVFDRNGDRKKHEKYHAAQRPFVCETCGKGFLFPKDLRRHGTTHWDDGAEEEVELGRGETQPIPIASPNVRRLYSGARPLDRRLSKLSSSFG